MQVLCNPLGLFSSIASHSFEKMESRTELPRNPSERPMLPGHSPVCDIYICIYIYKLYSVIYRKKAWDETYCIQLHGNTSSMVAQLFVNIETGSVGCL